VQVNINPHYVARELHHQLVDPGRDDHPVGTRDGGPAGGECRLRVSCRGDRC
jgi:hypothetical protein